MMQKADYNELAERIERQLRAESPMIEWHVSRALNGAMWTTERMMIKASIVINETQFRTEREITVEFAWQHNCVEQLRNRVVHQIANFIWGSGE